MLFRSAAEAFCRIMSYKYAYLSHTVIPLKIHLPGQQKVYLAPATYTNTINKVQQGILREMALTAYWKLWRTDDFDKNILFESIWKHICSI